MIEMNKKYRTRDGRPVRILCVDAGDPAYPVVAYIDNKAMSFTKEGLFYKNQHTSNDLVEVSPYEHLKVDDKVIVWNVFGTFYKRHFAGVTEGDGKPIAFLCGCTSFTKNGDQSWGNCLSVADFIAQYPDEAKKLGLRLLCTT